MSGTSQVLPHRTWLQASKPTTKYPPHPERRVAQSPVDGARPPLPLLDATVERRGQRVENGLELPQHARRTGSPPGLGGCQLDRDRRGTQHGMLAHESFQDSEAFGQLQAVRHECLDRRFFHVR